MDRTRSAVLLRSVEDLADAKELRAVISLVLSRTPIDESALRCAVWSFVGTERRARVPAALVITRLTGLIDNAAIVPMSARLALTRRVILWCVEEYFGCLGGDVLGTDAAPDVGAADAPMSEADAPVSEADSRLRLRWPTASPREVSAEPAPFPAATADLPVETFFPDWRRRLIRNLSRRSDSRWEPLTWVHADSEQPTPTRNVAMPPRPFDEHRDTRLWSVIEESILELMATREVSVNTAPDYVIGYLCQELVAKKLIVSTGGGR